MTNPKLDTMRADIETEIKGVEDQLATLRGQRDVLQEQIRTKVAEQADLRSALARLTPRRRRSGSDQPTEPSEA